jgi:hypothetical protein
MKSFPGDRAAGVILITFASVPGAFSLWRVLSYNSWLAVGRIPPPRRDPVDSSESHGHPSH